MDHADALALIEEAALEAGGLDRLMAGDTPTSVALAGHLAGCPECTRALAATRRTVEALAVVGAESPSSDLRARTLAFVASVGRPRGSPATAAAQVGEGAPIGEPSAAAVAARTPVWRRGRALALLGAAAVFALLAAGSFVAADLQGQLERTRTEAAHLHDLYAEIETLLQTPGARLVALRSDAGAAGALVIEPASSRIAVLSDDLAAPPAGMEYRCWIEVAGQREPVGRMWFEDGLAYWSGGALTVGGWPAGATFGVSLEPVDQPASGPAVLSGSL
jgi:hypothetical protein